MRRLVEGSLDRSVDVAATLELRGHSLPGGSRPAKRRSRDDLPLLAAGALVFAATLAGLLSGAGGFETYPTIELATDLPTLLLCAALPLLAALPFAARALRPGGVEVRHA